MIRRLSDISLRTKITISFVLIVIFGTAISTLIGSRIVTRAMLNEALKQIRHGLKAADMFYAARLETIRKSMVAAAETEHLALALGPGKQDDLPRVLAQLRDENHLQFLSFIEAKNRRVVRAWQSGADPPDTNPPPIPDFMDNALSGKVMAGTELLSHEALTREDRALADRARIAIIPDTANPATGGAIDDGMVMIAAAPVKTSAGFMGVIYGGILLNRDDDLVTQINDSVFGTRDYASGTAGVVSIFVKDVRIATNVLDASGQREFGRRTSTISVVWFSCRAISIMAAPA